MLSIGKRVHDQRMRTGWPLDPSSLNDRIDYLNNIVFETHLSNFAKYNYQDSEVARIPGIILEVHLRDHIFNPSAEIPELKGIDLGKFAEDTDEDDDLDNDETWVEEHVNEDRALLENDLNSNAVDENLKDDEPLEPMEVDEQEREFRMDDRPRLVKLREWMLIQFNSWSESRSFSISELVRDMNFCPLVTWTSDEVTAVAREFADASGGVWTVDGDYFKVRASLV